jgi:hypothetical protein
VSPSRVRGILDSISIADDDYAAAIQRRQRNPTMHDFIIALAFIGMVIAPAIVATGYSKAAMNGSK